MPNALHNPTGLLPTVLFDLDGTVVDTAPDLAFALNTVLQEQGHATLPFESVRPLVSQGARALIQHGFNMTVDNPHFEPLRQRFLTLYAANLDTYSRLFDGMAEVLNTLEKWDIKWGIVTNKPHFLTVPLLQRLNLYNRAACVVSGDTLPTKKPHPAPLLHACQHMDVLPTTCIYVGDAETDIQAGQCAGMRTLLANYGYIQAHETPANWGATATLDEPLDLLAWMTYQTVEQAL
ncbi:phosphoglycolate phosphatase [Beggiatoa leptomitoformis]|uniref:phosphoglycolate phosphatase n=1 Tax=Beggiatoa leptomitoformis TaxID=288004 RepID=A0A2N9YAS1_9GAMM|nr:phosphoglycolate phosphatase [Beggiatoa leptomitoformis]ALG67054.1 phosphoglycolate phosphatase [Beggiatoa leptomitoformis]AUI67563.1 phosphoglycolate phosphatase [Beggiatoa leptomitoformis]